MGNPMDHRLPMDGFRRRQLTDDHDHEPLCQSIDAVTRALALQLAIELQVKLAKWAGRSSWNGYHVAAPNAEGLGSEGSPWVASTPIWSIRSI